MIDVPAPESKPPTDEQFYSKQRPELPDLAFLKNHLYREGVLTEKQALSIVNQATEVLRKESNLLDVEAPVTGKLTSKDLTFAQCAAISTASFTTCASCLTLAVRRARRDISFWAITSIAATTPSR